MVFGLDLGRDQQVPESVMQDLLSMEEERMNGECRVPPIYNNNYIMNQQTMQYTNSTIPTTVAYGDFSPVTEMEDITLNYNVNGPLKQPEYVPLDSYSFPVSQTYTTIKQEPKDITCTQSCEDKRSSLSSCSDHKVSFTELDQILNCDLTLYEDMNYGVKTYKDESQIKVEYDSDPESCHSQEREGELVCSENFDKVQSEVVRQVKKDIEYACTVMDIPADPRSWSVGQVQRWITYTIQQYKLPMVNLEYFQMNGLGLSMITEEDFRSRSPDAGATLFAHLDIWLNASKLEDPNQNAPIPRPNVMYLNMDQRKVLQELTPVDPKVPIPVPISVPSPVSSLGSMSPPARSPPLDSSYDSGSFCSISDDEVEPGRPSIHLWQFLKELLMQPQFYGNCIRWLDRKNGVFKIEDSARVARLWGKRKNRPAMNYDKLSRSIRQYYKKGIIKKTENSKRLVYRFCHPYLL